MASIHSRVNDGDPQSAVHATAAEARTYGAVVPCQLGTGLVTIAQGLDHVTLSEIPCHHATPVPITSEARRIPEQGSVQAPLLGQGSLPFLDLLDLDASPVHTSAMEERGNQAHGILNRGVVPVLGISRPVRIPVQVPESQARSFDVFHYGSAEKGETADHTKRGKMNQIGGAELSGAANLGASYARSSNAATEHDSCTDKDYVKANTESAAAHACEEDMASVVRLLQDAIPKLTNTKCMQCAASPTAHTSTEDPSQPFLSGLMSSEAASASPPRGRTSREKIAPALSPVLIVGHHLPGVPIIAIESSSPQGRSPRIWHNGSCFLLPPTDEIAPLLGSYARTEHVNSNTTTTAANTGVNESLPPNRPMKFSREQIMILISMLLVDFSSFASMSIMAPFFPQQVDQRGLSTTVDGIIFSVYALVVVLASPFIGKMLPLLNTKGVYMAGIIIAGIANICFGFVVYVKNPVMFVVLAISLRVLVAFGSACFLTVIYTLVPVLFPDDMNAVNGMLETAVGVGMCVGPAVGVWLYSIGGFCLPFYGLGSFILLTVPVNILTFPQRGEISPELRQRTDIAPATGSSGLASILRRPGTVLPLAILSVTAVSVAVLYPTLQPHMDGLGVSVEGVGMVFLLMSAVYAVSSPLVGLATDRYNCPSSFMLAGLLLLALALILIGNSPLLPKVTHDMVYKQDVVAVIVIGLASAMSIVPTFASILYVLSEDGTVDIATFSLVGGLWSASYSLGEMLGPIYAGFMAEYVSFATSTTVTALLPASLAVVQGVYMCVECYRSPDAPVTKATVG